MRISTNMIYDMGAARIADLQSAMLKTQQQISTGHRVLTPADDPIAAASALGVHQALSMNEQFATNRKNAKSALAQEESALQGMTAILQSVKDIVVAAGNGSLSDDQRRLYLAQLNSHHDELLGIANTRDVNGEYIFSGFSTHTQPFSKSAQGATYAGDQGQRLLQVASDRLLPVGDPGVDLFERSLTGNGTFIASAAKTNTGGGVIDAGSVVDTGKLNGASITLTFAVEAASGKMTYQVTERPASGTPAAPEPFESGQAIVINGMQVIIEGKPANGDSFSLEPASAKSIFATLTDLVSALGEPMTGEANQAKLHNALGAINNHLDRTLDTVSSTRGLIGARLNEIEHLDNIGEDLKIQYADTLKTLIDVEPVAAYSLFTKQQYTLEAAQQSFLKMSGLSLFNLLR